MAEVDFARFKATGLTTIVDGGGQVLPDQGWAWPSRGVLNPQVQAEPNPNTGNNLSRTETGPVLTQAFQVFLGQTNVIEWGKKPYAPGENGGISGIVYYATTRAEDDPRLAVAEPGSRASRGCRSTCTGTRTTTWRSTIPKGTAWCSPTWTTTPSAGADGGVTGGGPRTWTATATARGTRGTRCR